MKKMRMMSFKQFIAEEQDDHSNGTYINVKPTDVDKDNLYNWVVLNKISNPLDKHEYHVTVIYSKLLVLTQKSTTLTYQFTAILSAGRYLTRQ